MMADFIIRTFFELHKLTTISFNRETVIRKFHQINISEFLTIILDVPANHLNMTVWLLTFWLLDDALEKKALNAVENAKKWIEWCSQQGEYGSILNDELFIWFKATQNEHEPNINYASVRQDSAGVCPTITAMFVFVPSKRTLVKDVGSFVNSLRPLSLLVGMDNDRLFTHDGDINLIKRLSEEEIQSLYQIKEQEHEACLQEIKTQQGDLAVREASEYRERFKQWSKLSPMYNE